MAIALAGTPTDTENASATSLAATYPTGITVGDLLLAHVVVGANNIGTTPPAGWTLEGSTAGSNSTGPSSALYYKIAAGTETGTVTFPGASAASKMSMIMERWSGVDNTTPFDIAAVAANATAGTSFSTPTVTTVTANAVIIYQVSINATSTVDILLPTGTTNVQDTTGTGKRERVAYETQATAGTSTARTWTSSPATSLDWGYEIVVLRPAGGSSVNYTPADSVGITDSAAAVLDAIQAPADGLGLTDSAATVFDRVQSPADPVGITDSASATFDRVQAPADSVGITDSATVTATRAQAPADPVGITDSATATAARVQAPADSVGITDSVTAQFSGGSSAADNVGLTDSAGYTLDAVRTPADPVGITDSVSFSFDRVQSLADSLGVTDTVATAADYVRTAADSIGIADTVQAQQSGTTNSSAADSVGITDGVTTGQDRPAALADNAGITDAVVTSQARAVAPADSLGITDAVTVTFGRVYTVADLVGITDQGVGSGSARDLTLKIQALTPRLSALGLAARFKPAALSRFSLALIQRFSSTGLPVRFANVPLGGNMTTTIHVSKGEKQYAGGTITETTGKDISAATFQVSLGSADVPGTAAVPDRNAAGATNNVRTVAKLIDSTVPLGRYWVWVHIGDSPENVLVPAQEIIVA